MQNTADLKGQLVLLQKKRKARSARRPLKLSQLLQEDITKRTSQSISWYTERLKNLSTAHEGLGSSEDETCEHDARPVLVKSRPFSYTKFDTLYDPFLRSGGLTQRQLHFNHLYMQDLVSITFGTTKESTFAPANFMTQLCLQHSVAAAQWTAVVAEEIMCALSGQPKTAEMALERAAANKSLDLALRNYRTNFQAAYLAVIKAAVASPWLGNTSKQNVFGLAADLLIRSVGGLKTALTLTPVLEPIHITAPFCWAQALIPSQHALERIASSFLHSIQQILRLDRQGHRLPFRNRISDVLEHPALPDGYQALEEKITQTFDCYITPEDDLSTLHLKFRLSLLIELCWLFTAFTREPNVILAQLRWLEQQCRNDPGPRMTKKERLMRVHQMAGLASHARREIMDSYEPSRRADCDLLVSQMEIDGYKLFNYESPNTRQRILARLYAWFTQASSGSQPFTAGEIDVLKEEIRVSWCIQHGKPVDRWSVPK